MKNHKNYRSLVIITSSIILVGFAIAGTWYLYQNVNRIRTENFNIRQSIASLEAENNSIRDFQAIRTSRQADIERINKFFIEKERPLNFIEAMESLGRSTRIRMSLDAAGQPDKGNSFTFRILAEGERSNIFRLISLIEKMPYYITVNSFSLNQAANLGPAGSEIKNTVLSMTISVRTK